MSDKVVAGTLSCSATALRKASRRVSQLYDANLAEAKLTIAQFGILTELIRCGQNAPTVTELAAVLVMDRSGLGQTLKVLARDGHIALIVNPEDGRFRNVILTAKGKALQEKAIPLWAQAQRLFAANYGQSKLAKLHDDLLSIAHDSQVAGA